MTFEIFWNSEEPVKIEEKKKKRRKGNKKRGRGEKKKSEFKVGIVI
jgi:hypothetical protein